MSDPVDRVVFPRPSRWAWFAAAVLGGVALSLAYGFAPPAARDRTIQLLLVAAAVLFLLSRLIMLIPLFTFTERFGRCWLDFAVMVAGGLWWILDRHKERSILEVFALYVILSGAWAAARGCVYWLTDETEEMPNPPVIRRLFVAIFLLAIVGGLVMSLPACWSGSHPATWEDSYDGQVRYELGIHALNCLFTATSALTGTGLTVHHVNDDFNWFGRIVLIVLMQIGGLAVLAVGTVIGLRLRQALGWQKPDDDVSAPVQRRAIVFVCILAIILEAIGFIAMYFGAPAREVSGASWKDRVIPAIFTTVSAFCNVGMTPSGDSLVKVRDHVFPYAVLLPLMVLGSIGGPTLHALWRRLRQRGTSVPADAWLTLCATVLLIVVGAGLLYSIESSDDWQRRDPRDNTPGRLLVSGTQSSPASSQLAVSERLRSMPRGERIKAAVFESISARTTGMTTVRLDENSLSPAGRVVLMAWMLIGGSVGGTAGGLRLCVCGLLLAALLRPGHRLWKSECSTVSPDVQRALVGAGAVVAAMAVLILVTTLVLVYRQSKPFEDCLFESVSACTNTGLSTGLTSGLGSEDRLPGPVSIRVLSRSVLILAMMLGRVLPLGILLHWTTRQKR